MFKIELNAHYLIFWTQIYHFLALQVIHTNDTSDVMQVCSSFYILWAQVQFFFQSLHFEIPEIVM